MLHVPAVKSAFTNRAALALNCLMQTPIALDLDHCGTIVRDLDRAQQAFILSSFNFTSRSLLDDYQI